MIQKQDFTHELDFLRWFDHDFPNFMTEEGMNVLLERKDEIYFALKEFFTQDYLESGRFSKYLKKDLMRIFESYQDKNYKKMAEALEDFKLAVEFI